MVFEIAFSYLYFYVYVWESKRKECGFEQIKLELDAALVFPLLGFGQVLGSVTGKGCCCRNLKLRLTPFTPDTFNQNSYAHTDVVTHYLQRKEKC